MYELHGKNVWFAQEKVRFTRKCTKKHRKTGSAGGRLRATPSDAERRRSESRSKYVKTQHVEALWCQNRRIRFLKKQTNFYILIRSKDSSRALQGPPQGGEKAGGSQRSKNATCVKSLHHRHDQKFQRGQSEKKVASSMYNAYEDHVRITWEKCTICIGRGTMWKKIYQKA